MLKSIILAAGSGTRMKSKVPKVLQKINNKYLVSYVIEAAFSAGVDESVAVVGYQGELVEASLKEKHENINFVYQREQLGTGHAVSMAKDFIGDEDDILVVCGDTPLIESHTLKLLVDTHRKNNNAVTGISVVLDNSTGYGRIKRDGQNFVGIVEQKDCTDEEAKIKEINTGVYCFKGADLKQSLLNLNNNNSQGELYLTDTLGILKESGKKVSMEIFPEFNEFLGINDKVQLMEAGKIMQQKINNNHMKNGVIIIDPLTTYIDGDVTIGIDTVIMPNTIIKNSTIGEDCEIGPNTTLTNMTIADSVTIVNSVATTSSIDCYTNVGPFAYIRPNSILGKHVKVGDFVEVKNSTIGDNSKASHLTYIGDSYLGKNINLGCGTITVNYDGKNKFKTVIEDDVFVGCNSNLIAPVTLKKGSIIGAGTTVTYDVPEKSLAIGRVRQSIKENFRNK